MHIVYRPIRQEQRQQRRMYLPSDRMVVNGVGLGELDGMFNIGKMFKRMFTITPSSFKFKNIAGTIGSAATTLSTFGMANLAAGVLGSSGLKVVKGPSFVSSHSKAMQYVGYGTMAAAAATGLYFGGSALLSNVGKAATVGAPVGTGTVLAAGSSAVPVGTGTVLASTAATTGGGFLSTAGSWLSNIGSGLATVMKALPVVQGLMGGKGGGPQEQPQQGGMTQAEFDAQQRAAYEAGLQQQRQQQIAAEQAGLISPVSYSGEQFPSSVMQPSMQNSYGDLRTPYTAITEDGKQVQVDPMTGDVITPTNEIPTGVMLGVGAVVVLAGWYFMSDSKK
jgi:hypothetical protein